MGIVKVKEELSKLKRNCRSERGIVGMKWGLLE